MEGSEWDRKQVKDGRNNFASTIRRQSAHEGEREHERERMKERKSLDTLADRMIRISRVDFSLAKSRAVFCVSSL